jgi:hypothetical protein
MIEYTLISSILDKICEMTKKTLKYLKYDIRPLMAFSQNQNMGNLE